MARRLTSIRGDQDRRLLRGKPAGAQLDRRHLDWLASLPSTAVYRKEVFLCHGTPSSDDTYWLDRVTDDGTIVAAAREHVEAEAAGIAASLILCGHTHIPRTVQPATVDLSLIPVALDAPDIMTVYRSNAPCRPERPMPAMRSSSGQGAGGSRQYAMFPATAWPWRRSFKPHEVSASRQLNTTLWQTIRLALESADRHPAGCGRGRQPGARMDLRRRAASRLADALPGYRAQWRSDGLDSHFGDPNSPARVDGVTVPDAVRNTWQSPAAQHNVHGGRAADGVNDIYTSGYRRDSTRDHLGWAGLDSDAHSHTRRARYACESDRRLSGSQHLNTTSTVSSVVRLCYNRRHEPTAAGPRAGFRSVLHRAD